MEIQGIDHIELFVEDAEQSAVTLTKEFGFEVLARGGPETGLGEQRSILLGQEDIKLVVTTGLTGDHPAARYVRLHGDGVSNIVFATPDAAGAFTEAVANGADPLTEPAVHKHEHGTTVLAGLRGFGDVAHTFIQRECLPSEFMPGRFQMIAPTPTSTGRTPLRSVDHLAVCVESGHVVELTRHYQTVFGFDQTFTEHIIVGDQAMDSMVVQNGARNITFTLIEPDTTARPGQIDQFLDAHNGPGVQHVAFLSDNIGNAIRALQNNGVEFLPTPGTYYDALPQRLGQLDADVNELRELNILVDRDQWGDLYQIFTRSTHERRTLFYEVIQRKQARTFGSGNIKALYEAVERERTSAPTAG